MRAFRCCRLFVALAAVAGCWLSVSAGQAQAGLIVVVEAPGGEGAGRKVRSELARDLDVTVLSAREAAGSGQTPNVILAATIDEGSLVSVQYWDRHGSSDVLRAPLPSAGATLEATITTLAAALLGRHVPHLHQLCLDPERELADCSALANLRRGVVSLTSLSVPRLRSAPVTMDDF